MGEERDACAWAAARKIRDPHARTASRWEHVAPFAPTGIDNSLPAPKTQQTSAHLFRDDIRLIRRAVGGNAEVREGAREGRGRGHDVV